MTNSAATAALDDNRFDELLVEYLEDVISDADGAKLDAALRDSHKRQRQFTQVCLIGQAIAESRDETLMELLAAELVEPQAERPPGETWRAAAWEWFIQPMTLGMLVSGIVMTIILLSLALLTVPEWRPGTPVVHQPSTEFVARISRTSGATFHETSDGNFQNRDLFDDDKIVLDGGLVVIEYGTGARVVLEGPATYHINGPNGGDLRRGKVVAQADSAASQGFTVAVPGARIVDVGTQFGAEVSANGGSQVAVLSGEVEVIGDRPQQRIRIVAGEGASVEASTGKIVRQDTADSQFASALVARLNRLEYPPIAVGATAERFEQRPAMTNTISGFKVTAGPNRKLVLAASWESADTSISAVWRGTEAFTTAVNSADGRNSAILYLDDPTPGKGDIVVTFGTALRSRVGAISLVNAAAGVDVTSTAGGVAGSLATTKPGSLVVGVYTTNDPNGHISGPFSQTLYSGDAGSCRGDAGFQLEANAGMKGYSWKVSNAAEDNHVIAAFVRAADSLDRKQQADKMNE